MDSPLLTSVFRQLFRRRYCQRPSNVLRLAHPGRLDRRPFSTSPAPAEKAPAPDSHWQQRSATALFPPDKASEYSRYPLITSTDLLNRRSPPKRVKLLTRDFIEDSLYNPTYGYFSSPHLVIFSPPEPFPFPSIDSEPEFHKVLSQSYTDFEDSLDHDKGVDPLRQLWHTPTELFRPFYGEAIARYLVANYKLTLYPYHDLIIYELGAGNGTLMLNILDYLSQHHPEVYDRTQFRIIEISTPLSNLQSRLHSSHPGKIHIINKSIFTWDTYVPSPCFFLAMEVFDNFPHDCIRYTPTPPYTPHQSTLLIDSQGEFYEFYTPKLDPLAKRFLRARATALPDGNYTHPLRAGGLKGAIKRRLQRAGVPFLGADNLSDPEWIPTRLLQFFEILAEYFPHHRLLTSDFDSLPDATEGVNAPVVQTRFKRRTITVTTPFVSHSIPTYSYVI